MGKYTSCWAVWVGGTVRAFRSERRARAFFALRRSQYGDALVSIETHDSSCASVYARNKLAEVAS